MRVGSFGGGAGKAARFRGVDHRIQVKTHRDTRAGQRGAGGAEELKDEARNESRGARKLGRTRTVGVRRAAGGAAGARDRDKTAHLRVWGRVK